MASDRAVGVGQHGAAADDHGAGAERRRVGRDHGDAAGEVRGRGVGAVARQNDSPRAGESEDARAADGPTRLVTAVLLTVSVLVNIAPVAGVTLLSVIGPARVRLLLPPIVTLLLFSVTALFRATPASDCSVPLTSVTALVPSDAALPSDSVPPASVVVPERPGLALGSAVVPAPPVVTPALPVIGRLMVAVWPPLVRRMPSFEPKSSVPPRMLPDVFAATAPLARVSVLPPTPTRPPASKIAPTVLLVLIESGPVSLTMSPGPAAESDVV